MLLADSSKCSCKTFNQY